VVPIPRLTTANPFYYLAIRGLVYTHFGILQHPLVEYTVVCARLVTRLLYFEIYDTYDEFDKALFTRAPIEPHRNYKII
jgi:hypothetical protein